MIIQNPGDRFSGTKSPLDDDGVSAPGLASLLTLAEVIWLLLG